MSRLKGRLKRLELQPALQEHCTCDWTTTHYEMPDGSIFPPYPPCTNPSGVCPEPGKSRITRIVIRRTHLGDYTGDEDPRYNPLADWRFTCDGVLQVRIWRDEDGRLRYHGPPRWHENLDRPINLTKGPNVPATVEEIVAELKLTDQTRS